MVSSANDDHPSYRPVHEAGERPPADSVQEAESKAKPILKKSSVLDKTSEAS